MCYEVLKHRCALIFLLPNSIVGVLTAAEGSYLQRFVKKTSAMSPDEVCYLFHCSRFLLGLIWGREVQVSLVLYIFLVYILLYRFLIEEQIRCFILALEIDPLWTT